MSRISRVPYHQNVYDLFNVVRIEIDPGVVAQITEWEQRNRHAFSASMAEFYTTSVTLRTSGDVPQDWTLTLPQLWSEFSNDEGARGLPEVFQLFQPRDWLLIRPAPIPSFELIWENQGNWVMCARDDGTADPLVDVSGACFLSPPDRWDQQDEWHTLGSFSEVLSSWFAVYYLEDFTPISYQHRSRETGWRSENAPPKPYMNGLWLRTPAEPFTPPILDYLTDHFGEPERTPRPGDVTTFTFRPEDGTVRVTADDQSFPGALSAWWVHADTADRLAELGRLLLPWGTLRDTLRADTDQAREVLAAIR